MISKRELMLRIAELETFALKLSDEIRDLKPIKTTKKTTKKSAKK